MPAPSTPTESCVIRFTVQEPDGKYIHDKTADHNDRFFRDWLRSTTWWAMRNGKKVTMTPVDV